MLGPNPSDVIGELLGSQSREPIDLWISGDNCHLRFPRAFIARSLSICIASRRAFTAAERFPYLYLTLVSCFICNLRRLAVRHTHPI